MADHHLRGGPDSTSAHLNQMRVAMVIQRFRPLFSGQGEQVELLCRALAARGLESTIVTSAYSGATSTEQYDGYRVVRLKSASSRSPARAGVPRLHGPLFATRAIGCLLRRGPFDVVHVHALTDALYTAWLWCRLRHRPLLFEMTLLGADDAVTIMQSSEWLAGVRKSIFQRCDGYAAISPALADMCRRAGLDTRKVRIMPQGVDIAKFRPTDDRAGRRAALGLPQAGPLLMFVGSLIQRKGIDLVLDAWSRIHTARPDAHLVLIGQNSFPNDPPAGEFLRQQLTRLRAETGARVLQLGMRRDIEDLLPSADLFVFPSRREGFGTVMIEAMACGVPCVVADQPGITDFIFGTGGTAGVSVPQDDSEALANEAVALLTNPARAQAMAHEARKRAVDRFDIERIADRYVNFYDDLIAGTRGSRSVER